MALHPPQNGGKLIFAPANDKSHSQADQYTKGALEKSQLDPKDPFKQFHDWFTLAQQSGVHQPETVTLSTASLPSGRVEEKFEGEEKIPIPEFWGGLRIKPEMVEFWQGRESRLHDRFQYSKMEDGEWKIDRLSPWEVEEKFEGEEKIPIPEFWGGLRIKPEMVEFWQGRESRLHDRFQYSKMEDGEWKIDRLSP
ncbi:related to pyridoxamine 5'-phosphate oxidase 1 [Phialocephala subalpina]|uniref:pyridoxal 5'-phosphate synthase n=1 Tax=Phialocephala subalpina TaxID=576137 RepID=A0A1L7XTR3_9HELO|nr:related to pyridoxamine 5'-phosphate oxidase 1 [Phialocephala subalpina]